MKNSKWYLLNNSVLANLPKTTSMTDKAILAKGLRKSFGRLVALNDLYIEINRGETYGLIGPNGAGKTTFIRIAVGLSKPDAGYIEVLGKKLPNRGIASEIGYMTQKSALYADLSAMENLAFFASLYGLYGRVKEKRIEEVLEIVELSDRKNDIVGEMSGGMVQRVSLAATLLHKPKLLFLDEPTAGVDPELRLSFWEHFKKLGQEGITIVVSTHHLDEAIRCHRIGMLRNGKLIACGTPSELMEREGASTIEEAFLKIARTKNE